MSDAQNDHLLDIQVDPTTAKNLELEGFRVASKIPPSVISKQLRDELIRILTEGDDGAFTVGVASRVEKFVIAAREILMTEKATQNDLSAMMLARRRRRFGGGAIINGVYNGDEDDDDTLMGAPMMPAPNENFGTQAIKQLIEAARSMNDSPTKLVEALAAARQNGLDDVAKELERRLGVQPKAVEAPTTEAPSAGVTQ